MMVGLAIRFDDNRALGDWVVNEKKLGGSLESLISAIQGKRFAVWALVRT